MKKVDVVFSICNLMFNTFLFGFKRFHLNIVGCP